MQAFHLDYDKEGDILEIAFPNGFMGATVGYELSEHIVLHLDSEITMPLRLMLISYGALSKLKRIELTGLKRMPPEKQTKILALLRQEPLNRFLILDASHFVTIADPTVSSLAA